MIKSKKLFRTTLECLLFSTLFAVQLSAQSADPSDLERMAKTQGYSAQDIEQIKARYSSPAAQPQKKSTAVVNLDQSVQTIDADSIETPVPPLMKKMKPVTDTTIDSSLNPGKLQFFGYSIFNNLPDAFAPGNIGPVDPGYIVGPGDVLRLSVWGQAEFQYEMTVNKEGKVFIPVIGQVYVTGIPFDQLQEKIKSLLSRNYSGLTSDPQRTFMDLSVAKLRPVRIFVMGEVKLPGGYTVSSSSTAFNALYSVGGVTERGSLRSIKVIRNGKEIAMVDVYSYLTSGRCTTDVRLQNNDVVFVPPRGKTVAMTGSVFRPAYYELKEGDDLSSLFTYSGGMMSATNIDRGQLFRVLPFDKRDGVSQLTKMIDINLKEYIVNKKSFELFDRDSICFVPLYNDMKNMVKISGAVMYPGSYQSDTLTLSSLIFRSGKVVEERYFQLRADLFRLNDDQLTRKIIPVDLQRLKTDPSYDQKLMGGDEVVVYDKTVEKPFDLRVWIEGEVNRPGLCTLSTNMTVGDALIHAGGFNRKAYRKKIDIYRVDRENIDTLCKVIELTLPDSLNFLDESLRTFRLEDRDRIVVRIDPVYNEIGFVKILGKVRFQGAYALKSRNVRLVDLVDRAGGLMSDAFLDGSFLYRNNKRVVVNFEKAYYQKIEKENILLQTGDSIYIPEKPNTIFVYGNVNNPGLLSFSEGERVFTYVNRAGGFADSTQSVLVTFPNGEMKKLKKHNAGPKLPDGSSIYVTKKPYVDKTNANNGPGVGEIIKDTLAIITSVIGIVVLAVKLQ